MARNIIEVSLAVALNKEPVNVARVLGKIPKSIIFLVVPITGVSLSIGEKEFAVQEGDIAQDDDLSVIYLSTTGTSDTNLWLLASDDKPPLINYKARTGRYIVTPTALNDGDLNYPLTDAYARMVQVAGSTDGSVVGRAARTTSSTGTPFGVTQFRQLTFMLEITAVTGTNPTLDIQVQFKDESTGNWITQTQFTQQTGTLAEEIALVCNCLAVNYRIKWTIGGTNTPGFTFGVNCHAKA